ncbi:hypothetical protein PYW08_005229 [Mythimna loreyi]|uniref:Uncharacterized protein n=1 Tax=Mythimna loreyi TaxID=667449 RepID=A0ACC2QEF3_9NEOP|nr:hypothetical protein PYW08_005229 [Mythimna loreyi]
MQDRNVTYKEINNNNNVVNESCAGAGHRCLDEASLVIHLLKLTNKFFDESVLSKAFILYLNVSLFIEGNSKKKKKNFQAFNNHTILFFLQGTADRRGNWCQ